MSFIATYLKRAGNKLRKLRAGHLLGQTSAEFPALNYPVFCSWAITETWMPDVLKQRHTKMVGHLFISILDDVMIEDNSMMLQKIRQRNNNSLAQVTWYELGNFCDVDYLGDQPGYWIEDELSDSHFWIVKSAQELVICHLRSLG